MWEAQPGRPNRLCGQAVRTGEEMRDELKRVMEGEKKEEIVTSCNLHITLLTNLG